MAATSEMKKQKLSTKQDDTRDLVDRIPVTAALSGVVGERYNHKVSMVSKEYLP